MAYRFRIYAPTEGVEHLYVYYDGDIQGVCFPEGTSTACWDETSCTAGTVAVEAVLTDGYVTTAWITNENGTSKTNTTDNYLWNHTPKGSCTTLSMRIEVEEESGGDDGGDTGGGTEGGTQALVWYDGQWRDAVPLVWYSGAWRESEAIVWE